MDERVLGKDEESLLLCDEIVGEAAAKARVPWAVPLGRPTVG